MLHLGREEIDWELGKPPSADKASTSTMTSSPARNGFNGSGGSEVLTIIDRLERIERMGKQHTRQLTDLQGLVEGMQLNGQTKTLTLAESMDIAVPVNLAVSPSDDINPQSEDEDDQPRRWTSALKMTEKAQENRKVRTNRVMEIVEKSIKSRKVHTALSLKEQQARAQAATSMQRFVTSKYYEAFSVILVLANVVMIALELETEAKTGSKVPGSQVIEIVFCVLFTLEISPRMFAFKWDFFQSPWDIFDFVIVTFMLSEQFLNIMFYGSSFSLLGQLSSLRVLRVVRLIRALRVIRVLRFFRELRLLFMSILMSLKLLLWAALVIGLIVFVFSVSMTNGFIEHCIQADEPPKADCGPDTLFRAHFGGLDVSMLSLYEAMAGGISWGELVDLLQHVGALYVVIFLAFITFGFLAILNVVTAIFVEAVMHVLISDREAVIQEGHADHLHLIKDCREIFCAMDTDQSGFVTLAEFQEAMHDERMIAFCNALDFNLSEADTLFSLMDTNHTGTIDIDEFITGFLTLKGHAQSMDVHKVMITTDLILESVKKLAPLLQLVSLPPKPQPKEAVRA